MTTFKTFDVRCIGASHIKEGKVCQDYALSSNGQHYAIAIVCDGHGGDKYVRSDKGSKLAAQVTKEAIKSFFGNRINSEKMLLTLNANNQSGLKQLITYIIYKWRDSVECDIYANPFTEAELSIINKGDYTTSQFKDYQIKAYGTTLIAVVATSDFWFGIHIGDGKCVVVSEKEEFLQPIPWDEKCFLNVTTSLCDEKALESFRSFVSTDKPPLAFFVASDGVDDTFGTDELLHNFYKSLLQLIKEKGVDEAKKEIENYLPTLSAKGSQDDVSIGVIINTKLLNLNETNI